MKQGRKEGGIAIWLGLFFNLGMNPFVRFRQLILKIALLCWKQTMMLSHCVVSAIWQVALCQVGMGYFWRSGLCKWAAGEGGSLSFRVWFIFFCSLIGFWILFSKEAVTPASNSLFFQVLLILISPPVLCRKSSQARHCSHLCLRRQRKLWWAEWLLLLQLREASGSLFTWE